MSNFMPTYNSMRSMRCLIVKLGKRFTPTATGDPLALVSNVQPLTQSSVTQPHLTASSSSQSTPLHLDSGYSHTDKKIDDLASQVALLAQHFRAALPPTNNQLRTSSNPRNQATVEDGRVVIQNVQGRQNLNQRNFVGGNIAAGNRGA